ncbi:MAG: DUF6929 family protein [Candidatus Sericytochromatia bacterium]
MIQKIIKKIKLDNLPSGSGIEVIDNIIYIIGDDSPFLYCLNFDFNIINKIELFKTEHFKTGRIPKKLKYDFECITKLEIQGKKHLLICGSGSNSNREKAYLVNIDNNYSVLELSLSELFEEVKKDISLVKNNVLNIEGLATNKDNIYFFDRENNSIFYYDINSFIKYLIGETKEIPIYSFKKFELEGINDIKSSFSGADICNNKIFFTSSVEDTNDAISDGEVYGSFIGYIEFDENKNLESLVTDCSVIMYNENIFQGKVESISIYKEISKYEYLALAVTDDDKGGSELLELKIIL